ncbi:hypothetical protein V1477_019637 [Vespula maculifrons]|uniref:Uncharacterized protein n=1 Tax=Vespula maculifrons TaxID=7453 RepID=A0ABD2AR20_VESMC
MSSNVAPIVPNRANNRGGSREAGGGGGGDGDGDGDGDGGGGGDSGGGGGGIGCGEEEGVRKGWLARSYYRINSDPKAAASDA